MHFGRGPPGPVTGNHPPVPPIQSPLPDRLAPSAEPTKSAASDCPGVSLSLLTKGPASGWKEWLSRKSCRLSPGPVTGNHPPAPPIQSPLPEQLAPSAGPTKTAASGCPGVSPLCAHGGTPERHGRRSRGNTSDPQAPTPPKPSYLPSSLSTTLTIARIPTSMAPSSARNVGVCRAPEPCLGSSIPRRK